MALTKLPAVRTPLSAKGVWIVPVSKVLHLGCLLTACRTPHCPCTDLTISAYSLDERVEAFGFEKGALMLSRRALDDQPSQPDNPLRLRLDVYTGELSGEQDHPIDLQDRRVSAIADALDGETLDALEALWRRQKGLPSHAGQQKEKIEPWERGDLVYWDQVFEVDRPEGFLDSGRFVVALDMYCVNPSCDCREVSVAFHEGAWPPQQALRSMGRVVASFDGKVTFEPKSPDDDSRLRGLWARYRRRHPRLRLLFNHYDEIRAFAAAHPTLGAPVPGSSTSPLTLVGESRAAPTLAMAPDLALQARDGRAARSWVSTSRKRSKALR